MKQRAMVLFLIADGRSIHTRRWADYFAQRGYAVHLITYTEHVLNSQWRNLYLAFIPRHLRVRKIIHEIRPDIVHAHFITKYGFHLLGFRSCPTVVSAWGDDILALPKKSRLIRFYTQKVLDSASLIYAVSQDIRNHIAVDFGIPVSKVRYLPFGIDTDLFRPDGDRRERENNTIEVFSNRGFFPVYDNETLVRGFAKACGENPLLRLTLKGEGPEEQQIREIVARLGLTEKVTFRKKTEYSDVPLDYRLADIFITTSVSDGTPVSVLEAMASGLPCIATSVGGIPEWVSDKETGILIRPRDPEQVAVAILSLAADPVTRSLMGTAARERILRDGQWKNLMAQAEKDYLELIKTYRQDRS